jgi:formylglycine-generating enzyme required for sulfatase activity
MSQTPPENPNFLQTVLENIKDMPPPLRFILVFLALMAFIWVGNVAIPDQFVPLIYLLSGVGMLVYLLWEVQQHWAQREERRDVQDHEFRMEQLKLQHEEEERKREHERKLKEAAQNQPPKVGPTPDPDEQLTDYLNWVVTEVSELPGIDSKAADDEQDGRLHLNQVYTALLTYEFETTGRNVEILPGFAGREQKPVSTVAQLDRHHRLVLLGDPGSGKSTFVNFVTLCLANERLGLPNVGLSLLTAPLPDDEGKDGDQPQPWALGSPLPLRIILRDFAATGLPAPGQPASDKHLWEFVSQMLAKPGLTACLAVLQARFKEGQALLLLDGLDEVDEAQHRREQIKQVVEAFARKYPASRILVTSRTYAYQQQQWQLAGFKDAQLTPFTKGQIIRFVDGWYRYTAQRRGMETQLAQKRASELKEAIFSQPRLHELAERPLLLTLMASLHAWRMGELPRQRQKLYEETVDLLLDRWEKRQKVWDGREEKMQPSLAEWLRTDREQVRELLNRLAYEAHAATRFDQSGTADIPQEKLLSGLLSLNRNRDAQPYQLEAYLRDRAGLLAARGEGVYTFPHRTFQEYLAACYLVDQDSEYPFHLAALCRAEPNKWREVLLLGGAKKGRNDVWFLADALCPYDPPSDLSGFLKPDRSLEEGLWGAHLAGQMLLEIITLDDPLNAHNKMRRERLQNWLVHCLTTPLLPPIERALAGRTLGLLGDQRPDVACVVPQMVDISAGPFLMGSDKGKDRLAYGDEEPQHTVTLPAYRIGKYPVTNGQFQQFMDAGGYGNPAYWTKAGWQQRQKEGWTEPRYWQYGEFNIANQPVVGVSWYEAVAYCNWLKAETGRSFRLPSEAMWEKGARGTDGRMYPWGNEWNPNNLNAAETNINRPSAVGIFPDGQSPYGVYDASGNVLEWCSTVWKNYPYEVRPYDLEVEDSGTRSWRGGAFHLSYQDTRAAFRDGSNPSSRLLDLGFRVAEHLSDSAS